MDIRRLLRPAEQVWRLLRDAPPRHTARARPD